MGDVSEQRSIFDFLNYRELLRELYNRNKKKSRRFSYRYFAQLAGFGSPSFLKRVIDGESRLSLESIEKIAKGFKLNREEAIFFKNLVLLDQASSPSEKHAHVCEILSLKGYIKVHPLSEAQYNLYAQWYFIPIRELVGLSGFREDPAWIASMLRPAISHEEARRALVELEQLRLLERDAGGSLIQSSRFLTTSNEVISSVIAQWHREMMRKAAESIDTVPRDQRDISSVTLRISKEKLIRAKELIQKFRTELVEALSESSANAVYELNLQLFPLTAFLEGESHEQTR